MSVFLSFLSESVPLPEPARFAPVLPLDPVAHPPRTDVFTGRNNRLLVWSWSVLDRPLERRGQDGVHVVGYVPAGGESAEDRFLGLMQGRRSDDCGSFAGVLHRPDSVTAYTSLSGSCSLFVRRGAGYTALSNRLGLLTALGPLTLRDAFLVYMCGVGRSLDFGTAFEEVDTMKPGEVMRVRADGVTRSLVSQKHLFEPFDMGDAIAGLDPLCAAMGRCLDAFSGADELEFLLSGGKDSRTLLALLDEHGDMHTPGRVHARTTSFCHDIEALSARALLRLYPLHTAYRCTARHELDDSSITDRIIQVCFTRGLSMNLALIPQTTADFPGLYPEPSRLCVGGLDCTMKYVPNTMPVDTYVHNTRFTLVGRRMVRPALQHRHMAPYRRIMHELLADKDKSYYQQLEGWWVPLSRAHSSLPWVLRPYFSPFLDTAFWKFFLSAPREFFYTHAAYYLIQRRASRPLWRVPYADVSWPPELRALLQRHQLPTDGLAVPPLRFDSRLPGQKTFGINESLQRRMRLVQPYLRDRVRKHRERFDFLEPAVLEEHLGRPTDQQDYDLLLMGSGLLAGVLLAEYGAALLNRAELPDIMADFSAAVGGPRGQTVVPARVPGTPDPREKWQDYDEALADRLLFTQNLRTKLAYGVLRGAPDVLRAMGFAPVTTENGAEHVFTVRPGSRFRLEALTLGPCPHEQEVAEVAESATRRALPLLLFVLPDKKEAVFPDLPRIQGYFGTVVPLQDGIAAEWSVEFAVPHGVSRLVCVFMAQDNAMPVYVADVRGQECPATRGQECPATAQA